MPVNFNDTTPPKKVTARRSTTPAPKTIAIEDLHSQREDGLNGLFQMISVVAMAFGAWADAGAINAHGPGLTTETVKLADKYESIGKGLDALSQVGPFTGVITAGAPLIIQLCANHKILSATQSAQLGATDPQVLAQQMQLKTQREAVAMQRELIELRRQANEEMMEFNKEMEALKEQESQAA